MVETFTKPQHLSSILAVLLAVVLVAVRHRVAARVAVVVAWIEIVTFTFFHGIPVEIGPSKPYWGDGDGRRTAVGGLPVDPRLQRRHHRRRRPAIVVGRASGRRSTDGHAP